MSPLSPDGVDRVQNNNTNNNPNDLSAVPCVLEDLMSLSPSSELPSASSPQQQQQQQLRTSDAGNPRHLPRPTSGGLVRKTLPITGATNVGAASASARPVSATSARTAGAESGIPTTTSSVSTTPRDAANRKAAGALLSLSPQNLAAASAAASAALGDQATGKQLRKQGRRTSPRRFAHTNNGGGGPNAASLTALLNDDAASGGNLEQEIMYPLIAALHAARDQLHLPNRVVEWMREVMRWNVTANAHDANEKICHLVETVRLVTLELFRMVDEIELLQAKAMMAWRTIPSGADSAGTARAHATFVDAHGRLRQVAAVFLRLITKWQQGHAQLFDMVRPAAVPATAPSSYVFTCAASSNDDYVVKLTDEMELLEITANNFSSMIFHGAKGDGSGGSGNNTSSNFMEVPSMAQSQRSGAAITPLSMRRGSVSIITGQNNNSSALNVSAMAQQSAEEFSIVRRPVSASALRKRFCMLNSAAQQISIEQQQQQVNNEQQGSLSHDRRRQQNATADQSSLGLQSEMSTAFRAAKQQQHHQHDSPEALELAAFRRAAEAELQRQQQVQEELAAQKHAQEELHAHFEERRAQSAATAQRWWRRVLAKQRHGTTKSMTDALFDEAVSFLSTTNQQRWTKRDTMLLHDIARRLHFLRCMRRIERFCAKIWIPKHFAVVKIQKAWRASVWRNRDKDHRRRRKAATAIQRWYHECLRRRARRNHVRLRRESAMKARALRAARSAASAIRPPPPAEHDTLLVDRQVIGAGGAGSAPFATLGRGNMCVDKFERTGGVEAHRWGDEEDGLLHTNECGTMDDDAGGATRNDAAAAAAKRKARPRSAAERFLLRPGKGVTSFTAKMMKYCAEAEA